MVAEVGDENLGFGLQAAERFAMDDTVTVALEWEARCVFDFFVDASEALRTLHGV